MYHAWELKFSVGYPERNRPLGTLRHRWESNIKNNLGEIGWWRI
jgi:hypothetical protein